MTVREKMNEILHSEFSRADTTADSFCREFGIKDNRKKFVERFSKVVRDAIIWGQVHPTEDVIADILVNSFQVDREEAVDYVLNTIYNNEEDRVG